MSHTIYRLSLHLPQQNNIVLNPSDIITAKEPNVRKTMLLAWFELNRLCDGARRYLYTEIPELYTYNSNKGEWTDRQRGRVITRMHSIHPNNKELFHLRMLLLHVRGAQSFDDLKTVYGQRYDSFTAAALALNIITSNDYLEQTIRELINIEVSHHLRYLFAMICVHGLPVEPSAAQLWQTFKESLSNDFVDLHHCSREIAEQLALQHIQHVVNQCARTMRDVGLPRPDPNINIDFRFNNPHVLPLIDLAHHLEQANIMYNNLNPEQKAAFDAIIESILSNNQRAKCFFIDGPGGTGKTYLIEVFCLYLFDF